LRIGFVPLVDSAPLLVAEELGLFRRRGLNVTLVLCASWAGLRDRLTFGALDGAQMLAPMPISGALGLGGVRTDCVVTATTSRNGNTLTLGEALIAELAADLGDPASWPHPLPVAVFARALARRRARGLNPPVLAVVFAYSSHHYLTRHWLASGGIDPDLEVRFSVVPPPLIAEQLAAGAIEGFCAGQPWGSRAVDLGVGRVVLTSADIWPAHPEKVLAFSRAVLEAGRGRVVAATAAVIEAIGWLEEPANRQHAAQLLHDRALPGIGVDVIRRTLSGRLVHAPGGAEAPAAELFFAGRGTAPDARHGAWWFGQMQRWGHVPMDQPTPVAGLWRIDLWREAALAAGIANPAPPSFAAPLE
jgi:ABC-type nitrate/sulfonate/bicarbonate transport system substrate-binding protein